jgi:hypothetical protein
VPNPFNATSGVNPANPNAINDVHANLVGTVDNVPADHTFYIAVGTTPGGPYTDCLGPAVHPSGNNTVGQQVQHTFYFPDCAVLAPATQFYFRTEVRDAANVVVSESPEATFTTLAAPDYFSCGLATFAEGRNQVLFSADNSHETPVGTFQYRVEVGPTAAGPWSLATLAADSCTADPNPEAPAFPVTGARVIELIHNTVYYVRWTLIRNGPEDGPDEVEVCGPVTTYDYGIWDCEAPTGITPTGATVAFNLVGGQAGGFPNIFQPACHPDTQIVRYGTTPGGPYLFSTPPANAANAPSFALSGLAPSTTYFYVMDTSETTETDGVYHTTAECSFTTLAAPAAPPAFRPLPCT